MTEPVPYKEHLNLEGNAIGSPEWEAVQPSEATTVLDCDHHPGGEATEFN